MEFGYHSLFYLFLIIMILLIVVALYLPTMIESVEPINQEEENRAETMRMRMMIIENPSTLELSLNSDGKITVDRSPNYVTVTENLDRIDIILDKGYLSNTLNIIYRNNEQFNCKVTNKSSRFVDIQLNGESMDKIRSGASLQFMLENV